MVSPPSLLSFKSSPHSSLPPFGFLHLATSSLWSSLAVHPFLSTTFIVTTQSFSEQSIPVWLSDLLVCCCPLSKVAVLTPRQKKPTAHSLFGRSLAWLDHYRIEQNFHPMLSALNSTNLDLSVLVTVARSFHMLTIGDTLKESSQELRFVHECCAPTEVSSANQVILRDLYVKNADLLKIVTGMSFFTTSLNVIVWLLCSATLVRSIPRVTGWVVVHPSLKLAQVKPEELSQFMGIFKVGLNSIAIVSWIQVQLVLPTWERSLTKPKFNTSGLLKTFYGLKSDAYSSFKERKFSQLSSQWERSTSSSTDKERAFPSPWYSSIEEIYGVLLRILPLLVDIILTSFKTRFLPNSTTFEPTLQFDLITSARLYFSNESHVDFYEILHVFRDLKKCFIPIYVLHFNLCIRLVICFNLRVFELISIFCIWKV